MLWIIKNLEERKYIIYYLCIFWPTLGECYFMVFFWSHFLTWATFFGDPLLFLWRCHFLFFEILKFISQSNCIISTFIWHKFYIRCSFFERFILSSNIWMTSSFQECSSGQRTIYVIVRTISTINNGCTYIISLTFRSKLKV